MANIISLCAQNIKSIKNFIQCFSLANIVEETFDCFNCKYTKAYLEFLNYVLTLFMRFNKHSKISIHELLLECIRFLRILGANFLKCNILEMENLYNINVFDKNNVLSLESLAIGNKTKAIINKIRSVSENNRIREFYNNYKKFYQTAFTEK